MSKRMILMALVTLVFSANSYAAINKAEAMKRLNAEHGAEVKTAQGLKELVEKAGGKASALSPAQRRQFNEAIAVIGSKVRIETTALQRVFLLKSDILADVIRLEDTLRTGTEAEKDSARTQIEMIGLVGKTLNANNYKSTEAQAATKLLSLDLTTLPFKATDVVKAVNKAILNNKGGENALVEAVREGTKGMKGSLEDLINCV